MGIEPTPSGFEDYNQCKRELSIYNFSTIISTIFCTELLLFQYYGDEENMGNVTIYPEAGFPRVFYPYLNQEGFRSPLVMIKFNTPANGIAINIICKV